MKFSGQYCLLLVLIHDEEAIKIIGQHPNPLAFYVYTSSKQKEKLLDEQMLHLAAVVSIIQAGI